MKTYRQVLRAILNLSHALGHPDIAVSYGALAAVVAGEGGQESPGAGVGGGEGEPAGARGGGGDGAGGLTRTCGDHEAGGL